MKPTRPKTPKPLTRRKGGIVDPVEVYCRLRTLEDQNDEVCIKSTGNCTVTLMPRDGISGVKNGFAKEIHYTFKFVFDENVSQKELFNHIAYPLIEDLVHGKNGLLFTYGVTSSGKTYTMTGLPQDGGLLPRCLETLFNSINSYQTRQYVFKPDKLNGFDIQSTAEAMLDMQKELGLMTPKVSRAKRRDGELEWNYRAMENTKVHDVDSDMRYAVFISYVEIYNNYIYDLLEDSPIDPIKPRPPQSKILREDGARNMYVFGVAEVEAMNVNEAFELFHKGQRRRRVAHTTLNTESSRSHSVFNIRLVQAPLDPMGADVMQDKNQVIISQLSLVDLAGSERTVRTRNTGDRLREAGNINTSLMALRECIETLRENQSQVSNKLVPYRKSKLTHLFKNFFEGEGKVRMIVCVNPRVDDYDEIVHVMRFAEMAQEVLIPRAPPVPCTPVNMGLKSGRGNNYRDAIRRAEEEGVNLEEVLSPTVYSLGPPFPSHKIDNINDEETIISFLSFLNDRKIRREVLLDDLNRKQAGIRKQLGDAEKETMTLRQQVRVFQMDLEAREQQVKWLERELSDAKEANDALYHRLGENEKNKKALESELDEKDFLLNRGNLEKEKIKTELQDRLELEKARLHRLMERRLQEKQTELEAKMCMSKERFRQLREILNSGDWEDFVHPASCFPSSGAIASGVPTPALISSASEPRLYQPCSGSETDVKVNFPPNSPITLAASISDTKLHKVNTPLSSRAVSNPRHRRASSQGDVWLAHQPVGNLELGTVFQPKMKKKKSCNKLNVKDVTKDVSKYALVHQEQDTNGELETQLYKGDVVPSCSGGAQVIFNDVETLRQTSPTNYNLRKRSMGNTPSTQIDVESRCRVGIEGRPPTVAKKPRH